MMLPLFHLGFVLLGIPYTEKELNNTSSGGTPYGPSHVAGVHGKPLTTDEERLCFITGKRLADIAGSLMKR